MRCGNDPVAASRKQSKSRYLDVGFLPRVPEPGRFRRGVRRAARMNHSRTVAELFPDEDHVWRLDPWNDKFHRTQAEVVRLYDATLARVEARADG